MEPSKDSNKEKMEEMQNRNRSFLAACEAMKVNSQLYYSSDSSSEDEIDVSGIMEKTFVIYEGVTNKNLKRTQDCVKDVLQSDTTQCLICIQVIKRNEEVWSCRNCYRIFHLHCISKWAKDSIFQASNLDEGKKGSLKWCCPNCRSEYGASDQPKKYFCFCGKVENPIFNPWDIPHGCGKYCDKNLVPECGHSCSLYCHPGPCPPCPQMADVSCCCGKSDKISRRCCSKEWTCGNQCSKNLSCLIHHCEVPCHTGECPPCSKESEQKCQCGSKTTIRSCSNTTWQCGKICSKLLKCGKHYCDVICHEPPCKDCPNSGPRLCPCGKNSVFRPCTEDISPCGDNCDKLLQCELHRCSARCHYGDCEKCLQMRSMKCRCGQREKSVPCCKEYVCNIKCKKRRDCGKHNCNRKCCIGNCPPCEIVCGKTLNCGKHKCSSFCHSGPCYPCRNVVDVPCNCGSNIVSVPCGLKKALPPRCRNDCKLPSECHHDKRHKHRCHFGACPPCRLTCGNNLKCDHSCPYRCHSAVLTKVEAKQKKEGPWDLVNSDRIEKVCKPCPPCSILVPVTCVGGHETQDLPCSTAKPYSCGKKCGRVLLCTNHSCSFDCHNVDDISDVTKASSLCDVCSESCQKPRKEGCFHSCPRPCHPEDCNLCTQHVKMKCHCQLNTMYIVCYEWTSADENRKTELICCSNRCPKEMTCGHRCILPCHNGSCSSQEVCKKKVTLRCLCKRKKKEIQCLQLNITTLICDDECTEHQMSLKALENEKASKKEAEERRIQEKELEEFLRKTEGKKKKKKKQVEHVEDYKYGSVMILGIAIVFVILAIILFTLVNS